MLGIDHSIASVTYRELFSFTKKASAEIMQEFVKCEDILGCIVISTCNRMEIWLSHTDNFTSSVYEELCCIKGLNSSKFQDYFVERTGVEAVEHLFQLSCGMKSKIMGEDQIVTQVKDALAWSREHYCTDTVLEVLFRNAVAAAKKVKTNIHISTANYSAIDEAIRISKEAGFDFNGKKCMVIGNGEMGKLTASALRNEGANVVVTVRQYRSGVVGIPAGCERINYGDRMEYFPECDLIASATSSPNVTLKYEEVAPACGLHKDKTYILIDLAVPRDIDPEIGDISNVKLYDIDSFKVDLLTPEVRAKIEKVNEMLREKIDEFVDWYNCKDVVPVVKSLSDYAAHDVYLRLNKIINKLDLPEEEKENLIKSIESSTGKVVSKIMFGLRDEMGCEAFRNCAVAAEKIYASEDK